MKHKEAIQHLEFAFHHNKSYKRKWATYIELSIIEAMEENGVTVSARNQRQLVKKASDKILRLFDTDWWEAQETKLKADEEKML